MGFRSSACIISLTACLASAQTVPSLNCKQNPSVCEIEIGGQTLTFGMPKDHAIEVLSRTSYHVSEDRVWSAEHKPDSRWTLTIPEHQPFAGAIKGGVRFKGDRLEGAKIGRAHV